MGKHLLVAALLGGFAISGAGLEYTTPEPYAPDGTMAAAPVPVEMHQKNTGGSDGSGLCVIASIVMDGRYLGWQEVEALWEEAKRRPGGYYPEKFDKLVRDVAPDLKYAHHIGNDYESLMRLSELGIPFGVTMDTGELYGMMPIEHMVLGVHFDETNACYVDNNNPGFFTWVSAEEWKRRLTQNHGRYWILALEPKFLPPGQTNIVVALVVFLALFLFAGKPAEALAYEQLERDSHAREQEDLD